MSALFLGSAILDNFISRMGEKSFRSAFVNGAESLLSVPLIFGLARGVTIVLNETVVCDIILY